MVGIQASQQKQALVQVSFVKNPTISKNLNFPTKEIFAFCYLNRKQSDESALEKQSFTPFFVQQRQRKTQPQPQKSWREF